MKKIPKEIQDRVNKEAEYIDSQCKELKELISNSYLSSGGGKTEDDLFTMMANSLFSKGVRVKNYDSLDSVSVSFNYLTIAPLTDLEKQFNISTHDAAIRTLKEMNIPQDLIEKKSNSR